MGLFHNKQSLQKKSSDDEAADDQEHFFDEYFREELRNHGRWYFEKVINENGDLFKQDLEATVAQVNTELEEHVTTRLDEAVDQVDTYLKEHVTKRLDGQFAEYDKTIKEAQDAALETMTHSTQTLQEQHKKLSDTLQENVTDQNAILHDAFEQNKSHIAAMNDAQDAALQTLKHSVQTLQEQYQELSATLQKNVTDQQDMLVKAFEGNMAQVVEHYVLGALGDQYDLKAQVPSIIKQMEANKQAIVDDMKL